MLFIKIFFAFIVMAVLGIYYSAAFTSMPFSAVSMLLNKIDGVHIEGATGSILKGFKVKAIDLGESNDDSRFLLEDIVADYEMPKTEGDKKIFHIKNISLGRFEIIGLKNSNSKQEKNNSTDSGSNEKSNPSNKEDFKFEIIIDNINIKNVIFKSSKNSEGLSLANFSVINTKISNNGFQFDSLNLNSNLVDVKGTSKMLNQQGAQIDLEGIIKKTLIGSLKEDMAFKLLLKIQSGSLKIKGSAFDGGVTIDMDPEEDGILAFTNMDFSQKIYKKWPIAWIDGTFSLPNTKDMDLNSVRPLASVRFKSNDKNYELNPDTFNLTGEGQNRIELSFEGRSSKGNIIVEMGHNNGNYIRVREK